MDMLGNPEAATGLVGGAAGRDGEYSRDGPAAQNSDLSLRFRQVLLTLHFGKSRVLECYLTLPNFRLVSATRPMLSRNVVSACRQRTRGELLNAFVAHHVF